MTNYDKLTLEIETDGTITPEDASPGRPNPRPAVLAVRQCRHRGESREPGGRLPQIPANMLEMPIEELDLPMRAYNSSSGTTSCGWASSCS